MAVFADAYSQYRQYLVKDQILIVEGSISIDDYTGKPRVRARHITRLEEARVELGQGLLISVAASPQKAHLKDDLEAVLKRYQDGRCRVLIEYHTSQGKARYQLGQQWNVIPETDLLRRLAALKGVLGARVVYSAGFKRAVKCRIINSAFSGYYCHVQLYYFLHSSEVKGGGRREAERSDKHSPPLLTSPRWGGGIILHLTLPSLGGGIILHLTLPPLGGGK